MKKRICIISFSPIHRDARVLRQIEYLAPDYDLSVIGYGPPVKEWPQIQWRTVAPRSNRSTRLSGSVLMALGRLAPAAYEKWYWQKPHHKQALELALTSKADAYHANDWNALPVAAKAAKANNALLVLDAHEYAPLEFEDRLSWRLFYAPLVTYFLRKYANQLAASTTVAQQIADRYKAEFGFAPVVILNTPQVKPIAERPIEPQHVRMVHHGGASPDRRLELMIETIALADERFSLYFMLLDNNGAYVQSLRELAAKLAPTRIMFGDPVPPAAIVLTIAEYDMGFYLLKPTSYNNSVALPNKFFDFLAAGLAVCVGPTSGMAVVVEQYGFGLVAPSFNPGEVAAMLNKLTPERLADMKRIARETAPLFSAEREMQKLVDLYHGLLG